MAHGAARGIELEGAHGDDGDNRRLQLLPQVEGALLKAHQLARLAARSLRGDGHALTQLGGGGSGLHGLHGLVPVTAIDRHTTERRDMPRKIRD